jgi:hypothetical protein
MEIAGGLIPLAVCAVRDAVLYHERLLQSETLRKRADYEKYLGLSVFLDQIVHPYRRVEAVAGRWLDRFFESDIPALAYEGREDEGLSHAANGSVKMADAYAF